jgi:uncharacterized membrane-anchored protein
MTANLPIEPEVNLPSSSNSTTPRSLASWRLWLPLLFQVAIVAAVPARDAYTSLTGRTVVLQTAPVDPYDPLRGYSQTLGYTISRSDTLQKLPGGEALAGATGAVYVVMAAPAKPAVTGKLPPAWQPVRVSRDRPTNLPANQVALKGDWQGWGVLYGLETYYMPEDQRNDLNGAIFKVQQQQRPRNTPQPIVVETKVDGSGNAVVESLWIRDRRYQF